MDIETVLVLQGGGSLGAYECGVYKTLHKHNIEFDIVAGTSIGGVNASIITGSKTDEPAVDLENFWLSLTENGSSSFLTDEARSYASAMYSAFWGNHNVFQPIWFTSDFFTPPYNKPYLYNIRPLQKILKEYVDFTKLKNSNRPRLIVTSTDIQNGKPVVFDSNYDTIDAEHVLASAGFPFYGLSWTKIDGRYLWDGSLQSNTPLTEVIDASPQKDKKVYIVNLFPHIQEEIPSNMLDVFHRARDIMHTDKTDHTIRMSRAISSYLEMLKEMHDIIMENFDGGRLDEKSKERFLKMESKYHKFAVDRGAVIQEITRIQRQEDIHFLFEDADFSGKTIRKLIHNGEKDTEKALVKSKRKKSKT